MMNGSRTFPSHYCLRLRMVLKASTGAKVVPGFVKEYGSAEVPEVGVYRVRRH